MGSRKPIAKKEIRRLVTVTSEIPLLVRGVTTENAVELLERGRLMPENDRGMFFFWQVKEGFNHYGIKPIANYPERYSPIWLQKEVEAWAQIHTERDAYIKRFGMDPDEVEVTPEWYKERFGGDSQEFWKAKKELDKSLENKLGVVVSFGPTITELPLEAEGGMGAHEVVQLHYPQGIPSRHILFIEPLGEKDIEAAQAAVGDIADLV